MGWFGRKASVGSLKSDLKEASQLPLDQRERLASEMAEFIEEMKLVMKSPDHESTLMREYQAYGDFRKALAVGGFSANWAQHAFRESYLLALIKASDDPKWFSEVHALLHGIRGPLGLPPKDSSSGHSVRVKDLQDSLIETMRSGNTVSEAVRKMGVEIPKEPPSDTKPELIPFAVFHLNGQPRKKGTYKKDDGGYHGPYEEYYENGELKEKGTYKDGEKHGPYEEYYEDGELKEKGTYKDGGKHGPYEGYYEDGELFEKGTCKDGKEHGPYACYHENGQLAEKCTFKDGKREGPFESYYENGQLEWKWTYKDGKEHGPYESYYENGQLEEKSTYKDGKEHGPYESYYENRELKGKGNYDMDEKCGEWLETGKPVTYDPCPDCDDE